MTRVSRRSALAALLAGPSALALGRTPIGGRARLKLPWPTGSVDPHAIDDVAAALFGSAIADALYAEGSQGSVYPALTQTLPQATPHGARVLLRPGLVSARNRALSARDAIWSLKRSRRDAGAGILARFAEPVADPLDPLAFFVPGADAHELARALAHPVTALLPSGFSAQRPDATGAFLAEPSALGLRLLRNPRAARGAAFLERIEVSAARDLADGLRAFEAGDADIGWLGAGLHRARPGAVGFNAGQLGWVVLLSGPAAEAWGAPGVAQQVLDAIDPARLSYLGLSPPQRRSGTVWAGPRAELLVADDSPHLLQIARALAALLSSPGHEVTPFPVSRSELRARKRARRFALLLDFTRRIGKTEHERVLSLLSAVDPELAKRPPLLPSSDPSQLSRTLALGIVGELAIAGAHVPELHALGNWDLGAVYRDRSTT
jgi:peptide/nickel transport system substrate-binding protein